MFLKNNRKNKKKRENRSGSRSDILEGPKLNSDVQRVMNENEQVRKREQELAGKFEKLKNEKLTLEDEQNKLRRKYQILNLRNKAADKQKQKIEFFLVEAAKEKQEIENEMLSLNKKEKELELLRQSNEEASNGILIKRNQFFEREKYMLGLERIVEKKSGSRKELLLDKIISNCEEEREIKKFVNMINQENLRLSLLLQPDLEHLTEVEEREKELVRAKYHLEDEIDLNRKLKNLNKKEKEMEEEEKYLRSRIEQLEVIIEEAEATSKEKELFGRLTSPKNSSSSSELEDDLFVLQED